ncbi:calcium-binding protein [Microvirga arabica]|uniref:Calcium-binding protein n=1 Tax=Microvirga arabica TaxID=1128671 RepID=A0ABV6Y2B0_9HYPH
MITYSVDGYTSAANATLGTQAADLFHGSGVLAGGKGDDTLIGSAYTDILLGGADDDVLKGGAGADWLDGGDGSDIASYQQAAAGVVASLADATQNTGQAAGDLYVAVEGLTGSGYADHLIGHAGANLLIGNAGNDTLSGGHGSDILRGGLGQDQLHGGTGLDYASYNEAASGVVVNLNNAAQNTGEATGDTYAYVEGVLGSRFNDTLIGDEGVNRLNGGAGADVLEGGAGADTLQGGEGWDFASYVKANIGVVASLSDRSQNRGQAAGDVYDSIEGIHGSRFGDTVIGNEKDNEFYGHEGDDILAGGGGSDYLNGGGYDYASYADARDGVVARLSRQTTNLGDAGGDIFASIEGLHGSGFNDTLGGSAEGNYLFGRAGHDLIEGEAGNDFLFGESGSDYLMGGLGADALDGGAGFDVAGYFTASAGVTADLLESWRNTGEAAGDSYVSIESINGSHHGDDLRGSQVANELIGNGGNDNLEGRGGGDRLIGGDGEDHAAYWSASSGVRASLLNSAINTGNAQGDTYLSIEGLQGSGYGDMLQGDGAGNLLNGQAGNDELRGEGGHDWIVGGSGHDTLVGGEGADWLEGQAGADVFRFEAGLGQVDQVADFNGTEGDRIALSTNLFRAFAPVVVEEGYTLNGSLKAAAFVIGASATTSAHRIVYNQGTGALSYDADGVGGVAQVQFAQLKAGTALSAAHFQMFTL